MRSISANNKQKVTELLFRHLMLYISIVSLIGAGLIQIPNFPCLIIGKIIQGICAGAEVSLAPLFISEMSPKCLKGIMGNINLSLLAFGIIISQCLYFMMDFYNPLSKVVVN
jgi:MFS family permease